MPIQPLALTAKALDTGSLINTLASMRKMQSAAQQQQMNQMAIEKAQREQQRADAFRNALASGAGASPEGMQRLMGIDPSAAIQLQDMLTKQQQAKKDALKTDLDLFGKIAGSLPDTPENYRSLYDDAVKTNPMLQPYLPKPETYKPGMMSQMGVSPALRYQRETAELAGKSRERAADLAASARLEAANLAAQSRTEAARIAAQSKRAPLTPQEKAMEAAEIERAKLGVREEVKQDFELKKNVSNANSALRFVNFNPETGEDEISSLIKKSTGSRLGAMTDEALRTFGISTQGGVAVKKLEQKANSLVLQLQQGKLGSGFSNADRDFLVRSLGDIQNPTATNPEKLGAWKEFMEAMKKISSQGYYLEKPLSEGQSSSGGAFMGFEQDKSK